MRSSISPRELAQAIGVSESSIKRWVDSGKIPARKTGGGHRRIPLEEAVRYLRARRIPVEQPAALGLDLAPGNGFRDSSSRLLSSLKKGNSGEVVGLLASLYLHGWSVGQILDGPLRYALEVLAELGRSQAAGIYFERRAIGIVVESLLALRQFLPEPSGRLQAVGAAPEGDPDHLGSLSARIVFEAGGMLATDLGSQTPLETLRLAAEDVDARFVWLHVSRVGDRHDLNRRIAGLAGQLERRRRYLLLGGRGISRLSLPAGQTCRTFSSLGELERILAHPQVGW